MSLGVSMQTVGLSEARAGLVRVASLSESATTKGLAAAGVEGGNSLKTLLNQPKHIDPFWGVTGAQGPTGLARRSGLTSASVIAPGTVYNGPDGSFYTFIAHASPHVAQLEDGGQVPGGPFWIPTSAAQTPAGVERSDFPGAFVWPTERMKNFKGPRPKTWLVMPAPKAKTSRGRGQYAGGGKGRARGPMTGEFPAGLIFLKLKKDRVTTKAHHSFAALRAIMEPRMAMLGESVAAEVVRSA